LLQPHQLQLLFHHYSRMNGVVSKNAPAQGVETFTLSHKCPKCPSAFERDGKLQYHLFRAHDVRTESNATCNLCQTVCYNQNGLTSHSKHYCPKRENPASAQERATEMYTFAVKLCSKCTEGVQASRWALTKDDRSLFKTFFICKSCFSVNYPNE